MDEEGWVPIGKAFELVKQLNGVKVGDEVMVRVGDYFADPEHETKDMCWPAGTKVAGRIVEIDPGDPILPYYVWIPYPDRAGGMRQWRLSRYIIAWRPRRENG